MSSPVIVNTQKSPGCLVQVLWFVFIGWWLGQIWIAVSWILMLTIVGIPLSVMMLNKIPQVIAMRGQESTVTVTYVGGETVVARANVPQRNIVLRAIYFILIGWWLSAIVMEAAYILCLTVVGLPLGFVMFDAVPGLVSLHR